MPPALATQQSEHVTRIAIVAEACASPRRFRSCRYPAAVSETLPRFPHRERGLTVATRAGENRPDARIATMSLNCQP